MKFKQWLLIWLENYVKPGVKMRTYTNYKQTTERKVIPTVSDNGVISFAPVDGATYYLVNVDGTDNKVYDLSYDGLLAGTHTIKICAKADSDSGSVCYYSKYSASKTVTICGEVDKTKISFNSLTSTLSWQGISYANGYEISVQTSTDSYSETVNKTSYEFDPHNANFTISIRALGNHATSFDSNVATEKTFVYLETARNIHLEDGVLYWDDVVGADYKLKTPKLTLGTDRYTWNAVSDATSYVFYIDGEVASLDVHVSGEEYYVIPNFNKLKTYTVQVKAIGDGGRRTISSGFATIEQETRQLSTPDFKIGYSESSYKANGEILVDITLETPNANGYAYIIGGVVTTSTETSFRYNPNGAGKYEVGVYAIGGIFDENNVYCLSSQTCGNNSTYSINLLGSVDESSVKLSMDGRITWGAVDGAVSYTIKLTINGEDQELITTYNPAYDLSDIIAFKNVSSLDIEIQAHGNSKCISSSVTTKNWPVVIH